MLGVFFRYVRREIANAVFQGSVDGVDRAVRFFSANEVQVDRDAAEAATSLPHNDNRLSLQNEASNRKRRASPATLRGKA